MTTNDLLLMLGFFTFGTLLRLFQRAVQAKRSKVNTYPTLWSFVAKNWPVFLIRFFMGVGLFFLWLFHPGLISEGLIWLGVKDTIANWMTVPPTLGTAGGFGFFVDLGLDQLQTMIQDSPKFAWLPKVLKGEIPSYDLTVVDISKL